MDKGLAEHLWARALGCCCLTVSLAPGVRCGLCLGWSDPVAETLVCIAGLKGLVFPQLVYWQP